jgi:hypothetical protein
MYSFDAANGFDFDADLRPRRAFRSALCVHFSGRRAEHVICFAEPAPALEVARAGAARLVVEWDDATASLLRGRALLRGEVACDAWLLTAPTVGPGDSIVHAPVEDRALLRAAGVPRDRATLLARMPERPLLATSTRGPDLSPQLLRRIHSLLLAHAATADRR